MNPPLQGEYDYLSACINNNKYNYRLVSIFGSSLICILIIHYLYQNNLPLFNYNKWTKSLS